MDTKLKITYIVETVVDISEEAREFVLEDYAAIRYGAVPLSAAPDGYAAAVAKLDDEAPSEIILRTLVGEITSLIITNETPKFYPLEGDGITVRISKVAYQETPEKLAPPEGSIPLVVQVGGRGVH